MFMDHKTQYHYTVNSPKLSMDTVQFQPKFWQTLTD